MSILPAIRVVYNVPGGRLIAELPSFISLPSVGDILVVSRDGGAAKEWEVLQVRFATDIVGGSGVVARVEIVATEA